MMRRLVKKLLGRADAFRPSADVPDWAALLERDRDRWEAARAAATGPEVLIATSTGGALFALTVESTLAVALTLRGARVHLLLCDERLPACMMAHIARFRDEEQFLRHGPALKLCESCHGHGRHVFERLGLPLHRYGELMTGDDAEAARLAAASASLDEIERYEWDGLAVGEHALAGALRFVTRGDFEGVPHAEAIARRYLESALLTARGMRRLFGAHAFEHAAFHHGIYVPQGIIGEVARRHGAHVVNWGVGYRESTFLFSHERSYHKSMMYEPRSNWEDLLWTPPMEEEIMTYLHSRSHGAKDWIKYVERPVEDAAAIEADVGVDLSRPCVALLTNVVWDAQIHFEDNALPDMLAWVMETIRYFAGRPEIQLIVRAHPGERKGMLRSRQPVVPEIRKAFPELPENVFLIPPESRVGTYAVADHCDAALIYGTNTGIELAARGIPVIVAGEAWVRNKGVTLDAESIEEYFRLLDRLPLGERLDEATTRRARKYAYHFYFRRLIPWACMEPTGRHPPFRLDASGLDALAPGRDEGLDIVCDGILDGSPFIYPAEHRHLGAARAAAGT